MDTNIKINYVLNENINKKSESSVEFLSKDVISSVRKFHRNFHEYDITPMCSLKNLAKHLNVKNIWVKDESKRFNLNAFKVLGGSYAIGKYISEKLQIEMDKVSMEYLSSKEVREKLGGVTFVTATDGNHGRGVAWSARKFGQKSVVYMPKGSTISRLENIRKEGAMAQITNLSYDDAVRLANDMAQKNGWVVIQDTAWEGYEKIPTWIMQGYTTLIDEVVEQIEESKEIPTHVVLQAGVGSFAGAILGYLKSYYKDRCPKAIIVEPDRAACIYKSAYVGDGKPYNVDEEMNTIMAGLACGEPNPIGWNILRDYGSAYISCSDEVSARGMRILSSPLGDDTRIISGESGAVGIGIMSIMLQDNKYEEVIEKLNIKENSNILFISTEGDTNPEGYRNIVWDGIY